MIYSVEKNKSGGYDIICMGMIYDSFYSLEGAEREKSMLEMADNTKGKLNRCVNNILAMLGQDEYEYLKDFLGGIFEVKL